MGAANGAGPLARIFGLTFVHVLDAPALVIGRDTWSRTELAGLGLTQLKAARAVSELARTYKAKSTNDLYKKLSPASLAGETGFGLHCLYVLWRAFEAKGLDAGSWYWHGREGALRTFSTLKHREARERARSKKRQSRRVRRAIETGEEVLTQ